MKSHSASALLFLTLLSLPAMAGPADRIRAVTPLTVGECFDMRGAHWSQNTGYALNANEGLTEFTLSIFNVTADRQPVAGTRIFAVKAQPDATGIAFAEGKVRLWIGRKSLGLDASGWAKAYAQFSSAFGTPTALTCAVDPDLLKI